MGEICRSLLSHPKGFLRQDDQLSVPIRKPGCPEGRSGIGFEGRKTAQQCRGRVSFKLYPNGLKARKDEHGFRRDQSTRHSASARRDGLVTEFVRAISFQSCDALLVVWNRPCRERRDSTGR